MRVYGPLLAVLLMAAVVGYVSAQRQPAGDCRENIARIDAAVQKYWSDHGRVYPGGLVALVPSYLPAIPTCPSARQDTYTAGYQTQGQAPRPLYHYTIACRGDHHRSQGLPTDQPALARPIGAP